MNRYSSYFYYFFSAKKRHNIHSPFVYEFSDRCLSMDLKPEDKRHITTQFNTLSKNKSSITISDFGAGSKIMGNTRRICDIFKNSRSSKKYAELLYKLSAHYKPKHVLEFGTSLAWGTLHIHLGNPKAIIDTVEGCPQTFSAAKSLFPIQSEKIQFHNMTFDHYIDQLSDIQYDLIFIDGNHRGSALKNYIERLFPFSNHDTIWILDDIRWSDDMWEAWEDTIQDLRFHVTIDYLRMGIALRRESQVKEAFCLK